MAFATWAVVGHRCDINWLLRVIFVGPIWVHAPSRKSKKFSLVGRWIEVRIIRILIKCVLWLLCLTVNNSQSIPTGSPQWTRNSSWFRPPQLVSIGHGCLQFVYNLLHIGPPSRLFEYTSSHESSIVEVSYLVYLSRTIVRGWLLSDTHLT